jgi:lipoate---protein ligase
MPHRFYARASRLCCRPSRNLPNRLPRSIVTARLPALKELVLTRDDAPPLVCESTSTDPYLNLAIEDYLLRNSHHSSRILLFYTNRPCVVIGRNQNPWLECNINQLRRGLFKADAGNEREHSTSESGRNDATPIELVRRRSGGGTVFHDLGNLNYSVIVPNDASFNRRKHAEMVVRGLQNVSTRDIKVNERHDIVMRQESEQDWVKISGSAFKLIRGRALHHGTLLFSSPNLLRISELLRSPGRGYIHAKGVESVRSKVGNLMWTPDSEEREHLKEKIVREVASQFWRLYGSKDTALEENFTRISPESDGQQSMPEVEAGADELRTNEWRFGQTPRFDFDSGTMSGIRLRFHANRGGIEQLTLSDSGGPDVELREAVRVQDINDWTSFLRRVHHLVPKSGSPTSALNGMGLKAASSQSLVDLLQNTFPRY